MNIQRTFPTLVAQDSRVKMASAPGRPAVPAVPSEPAKSSSVQATPVAAAPPVYRPQSSPMGAPLFYCPKPNARRCSARQQRRPRRCTARLESMARGNPQPRQRKPGWDTRLKVLQKL